MGNKKRGGGGVNDQNPLNEIKAPVRIPLFGVESFSFNESAKKNLSGVFSTTMTPC